MLLETTCDTCFLNFSEEAVRRPKLLPCGHTMCRHCIGDWGRCLVDEQVIDDPQKLKDNTSILEQLQLQRKSRKVLGLLAEANRKVEQTKHKSHSLLKKICGVFQRVGSEMAVEQNNVEEASNFLQESLSQGTGDEVSFRCELGEGAAERAVRASNSLQQLLDARGTVRLQLPGGEAEDVLVDLDSGEAESGVARLLLLLLHKNGKIRDHQFDGASRKGARLAPGGREKSEKKLGFNENRNVAGSAKKASFAVAKSQSSPSSRGKSACAIKMTAVDRNVRSVAEYSSVEEDPDPIDHHYTPPKRTGTSTVETADVKSTTLFQLHPEERDVDVLVLQYTDENRTHFKDLHAANNFGSDGLHILANSAVSKVMEEVRCAGRFSLLIDTVQPITDTPSSEPAQYAAMFMRYCSPSGEPVERLVALQEALPATGTTLFETFTHLCDRHKVDWASALCGVATDTAHGVRQTYTDLLGCLQERAPEAALVWNSNHSLEDIISEACKEIPGGLDFFNTLDTLRLFFKNGNNFNVLGHHCGIKWDCLFWDWDSYAGTVAFVDRKHEGLTKSLGSLRKLKSPASDVARSLLTKITSPEFLVVLFLFVEIFNVLRGYLAPTRFSRENKMADSLLLAIQRIKLKLDVSFFQTLLIKAQKYSDLTDADVEDGVLERSVRLITVVTSLSKVCVETIAPRFLNTISVMRDVEMLSAVISLHREHRDVNECYQYWNASQTERWPFFKELASAVKKQPRHNSDEEAVAMLVKKTATPTFAGLYPTLCAGLQRAYALPVLPAAGGFNKLTMVRKSMLCTIMSRDSSFLPLLEAKLIVKCAMDSEIKWHEADSSIKTLLLQNK